MGFTFFQVLLMFKVAPANSPGSKSTIKYVSQIAELHIGSVRFVGNVLIALIFGSGFIGSLLISKVEKSRLQNEDKKYQTNPRPSYF